jgi:hypothetical protein
MGWFWSSFTDNQFIAIQFGTIHGSYGGYRLGLLWHFNKTKPFGLICIPVNYESHALYFAVGFECNLYSVLG